MGPRECFCNALVMAVAAIDHRLVDQRRVEPVSREGGRGAPKPLCDLDPGEYAAAASAARGRGSRQTFALVGTWLAWRCLVTAKPGAAESR